MSMKVVTLSLIVLIGWGSCFNEQYDDYIPGSPNAGQLSRTSSSLSLKTFIFNCFPDDKIAAFVTFEANRANRLRYGDVYILNAALTPNSDFVIQFRQTLTDVVIHDLTDYGFMEPVLHPNMQILLLIGRDTTNAYKPKHYLETFDLKDVQVESSKVYVYNAILNMASPRKGINVYGFYLRKNIDGSESESVTLLVDNLPMNSGKEISIEPGRQFFIRVTYEKIGSLFELKTSKVVAQVEFTARPATTHYLILHGDYSSPPSSVLVGTKESNHAKPAIRIINGDDTLQDITSSSAGSSCYKFQTLLNSIIICVLLIMTLYFNCIH